MKAVYIFPGQGAQYVGMGRTLYEKFKNAHKIFDTANKVLNFDIAKLCFEGPEEELIKTEISQPAILTTSVAALANASVSREIVVLRPRRLKPSDVPMLAPSGA